MSIISLKNVSKYYYSKGVIASGFTKVSLSFDVGEFVAITGESGSGKSTLLNVISGLDTYEEGEMYILGSETSHYGEAEFEEYRRKYVGNIFQNFNLVNSYTVYQNIELVLLLNGCRKKDIKDKVLDLIKRVNLYKFRNTKVSKLSGGQKQRVAIARALAKETPIIIADEPTGNLDSRSAKAIIKLLSDIAKEKLVIIVTHNYKEVEEYVTRRIVMHDGKVLEDQKIREADISKEYQPVSYKNITLLNKIRLGIRNTFNIVPKFLLVLAVYLFIVIALMAEYSYFKEQEYIASKEGWNQFFSDTSDKRIIINKQDKSVISDSDYDKLSKLNNIDYVVKNDLFLDTELSLTDDNNFWLYGTVDSIDNFYGKLDVGVMPSNDNEVVIVGNKDDYYLGTRKDDLLDTELYIEDFESGSINKGIKLKIVGIKYDNSSYDTKMYFSDKVIDNLKFQVNLKYSKVQVMFLDTYYESSNYDNNFKVVASDKVSSGKVYVSGDLNSSCKKENCVGQSLEIEASNLYYTEKISLIVDKTYNKDNMKKLLDIDNYLDNNGCIYISYDDYNKLFDKDNYQSTVYVEDVLKIDDTNDKLQNMGYNTLVLRDTLVKEGSSEAIKIFKLIVTLILVVTLFFISYFVIRIILKSRNVYFSTIRMLGATKKVSRELLIIELLNVASIAYFGFLIIIYLNSIGVIDVSFIKTIINYMRLSDYIILYLILIVMSILISMRFSRKLFKNSAIKTIGEEV